MEVNCPLPGLSGTKTGSRGTTHYKGLHLTQRKAACCQGREGWREPAACLAPGSTHPHPPPARVCDLALRAGLAAAHLLRVHRTDLYWHRPHRLWPGQCPEDRSQSSSPSLEVGHRGPAQSGPGVQLAPRGAHRGHLLPEKAPLTMLIGSIWLLSSVKTISHFSTSLM